VPSLEALARLREQGAIELVAAVTRPDRPGHRGRISAPAVKTRALQLGLPVLQPERLSDDGLREVLALRPEALVWAAYGAIVPRALLDAVGGRAVNVHPSLLPRWRGAEPVAHAILAGERETGVTLMQGSAELDAGDILAQELVAIGGETTGELEARLAEVGARLLERELPRYLRGEIEPRPQDPAGVKWAPKLDPAQGELDFERPADELARVVRAYAPDPGAFTFVHGKRLRVLGAQAVPGPAATPGELVVRGGQPELATAAGWLRLLTLQPAGKRAMSGADWARGAGRTLET